MQLFPPPGIGVNTPSATISSLPNNLQEFEFN
jgi:hypothetical protein